MGTAWKEEICDLILNVRQDNWCTDEKYSVLSSKRMRKQILNRKTMQITLDGKRA